VTRESATWRPLTSFNFSNTAEVPFDKHHHTALLRRWLPTDRSRL